MDPAALNLSKELRENLINATQELINLWLDSQDYKSQRAIERRLQRLVTGLPWLLGSLYPWEQEFLLLDLGLHHPSTFTFEQPDAGDKLFQNGPVPLKLTTLETVTHSRASPEAGLQPSANSGPLEAKLPAVDCTRLSLPEQGQGSVQLQPSSCVPEAHVPTGFVLRMPGAFMPTGFEPIFAGGTEEPIQLSPLPSAPPSPAPTPPPAAPPSPALKPPPAAPPAFVSGILTSCSLFVFTSSCSGSITACTSGCSSSITACTSIRGSYAVAFFASVSVPSPGPASEPSASPASASASPSSSSGPASSSASSSGPASSSASSSGPASSSASSSGPASSSASSSGPASSSASSSGPASSSASASPAAAASSSSSAPAAASPGPASASAPASPGSASAAASASSFSSSLPGSAGTSPSGPRPASHFHWPFSRPLDGRHRRCGRPPERGCRRHRLPRGRPPDLCGRHRLSRGRPPELFARHHGLLHYRPPGRPPELCFNICSPVCFVNVLFGTLRPPFWSWSGPSVLGLPPPARAWRFVCVLGLSGASP
ncbi:uncharacterized protein LOC106098355 [Oreochromis niloticus]|uniref:uncharacterized protein LOC106098355 n=1 Tax=Oreochromis niloticus TaxID=8128 RepID=UPI000904C54A|nr:uncharacterized protein LOC106098355 [Oreochromis niloticus]